MINVVWFINAFFYPSLRTIYSKVGEDKFISSTLLTFYHYIYIYIYTHIYTHIYIHIYIYISIFHYFFK